MKQTHKWFFDEIVTVYVKCPNCRKLIKLEFLFTPDIGDSDVCYECDKEFIFGEPND